MFPTKCEGQNDRMERPVISCFGQHLDFELEFATKISISILPALLRFLYLPHSFHRRYVSCMYNTPNIYIYIYIQRERENISNKYTIYSIYGLFGIFRLISNILNTFCNRSHTLVLLLPEFIPPTVSITIQLDCQFDRIIKRLCLFPSQTSS